MRGHPGGIIIAEHPGGIDVEHAERRTEEHHEGRTEEEHLGRIQEPSRLLLSVLYASASGAWCAEPGNCASFQTADAAFGWAAWQVMSEGCPRVASQLRASPAEPGNR